MKEFVKIIGYLVLIATIAGVALFFLIPLVLFICGVFLVILIAWLCGAPLTITKNGTKSVYRWTKKIS
jgi:hypothetical protein